MAEDGTVVSRRRIDTPTDEATPSYLTGLITEMAADSDASRLVVGMPGIIDTRAKRLATGVNLPDAWLPVLSVAWLAENTGLDVRLANDADLAAVGEAYFGAGADYGDTAYVTVSTGIGAGVVVGGRVDSGLFSGGEIGHTVVDMVAAAAGGPATVEEIGSGTAMNRAAAAAGLEVEGAALAELVRAGHPEATAVWDRAMAAVGLGIVNLCWFATPDVIVIGGGVGLNTDLVLGPVADTVARFGPRVAPIPIVAARLGDDAALAGAARWWQAREHA